MTNIPVTEGQILLGKYRVERVLGKGGMGGVVAARHLELGELYAIKFLLPQAMERPEAVERFIREARASARLRGVHVARVHDADRSAGAAPYMIMEHLVGQDLELTLKERGPLSLDDAITYMLHACEAVAEAHSHGIIHRDLKPSNLFLTTLPSGAPCVKVLDFGISKQLNPEGGELPVLTQTGAVLGSPLYMSPEQMLGEAVDPRSDIWSLGAVLFQLLTGRHAFNAPTLPELVARILQAPPQRPCELREGLPEEVERLVLKCLEKTPERRFQTVQELMAALRQVEATLGSSASSTDRMDAADRGPVRLMPPARALSPSEESALVSTIIVPDPAPAAERPSTTTPLEASEKGAQSGAAAAQVHDVPRPPSASPPRSGRARAWAMGLVAGAAASAALVFMSRSDKQAPAIAASASRPAVAEVAPPPTAQHSKAKRWWSDLPEGKTEKLAERLPAPRFQWLKLHEKATALERDQKHEEADATLREALELARKQLGVEDAAYAETLQELAMVAARMGKLEAAEALLREALKVLNQYGDPSEEGFDDARQALVAVLVKQGKTEEARQLWKEGVDPPLPTPPAASASAQAQRPAASASREQRTTEEIAHMIALREKAASDPAAALRLADEGQQRFPGGVFSIESEFLAISSLSRLGRMAEARRRGEQFIAAHPTSSYADRVRAEIGPSAAAP